MSTLKQPHLYISSIPNTTEESWFSFAYQQVSLERREKIDQIKGEKGKYESLCVALLLQQALFRAGYNPLLPITYNENQKPYIKDSTSLFFSLSHSKGVCGCVLAPFEIGLDIEKITQGKEALANRFFHENEVSFLRQIPDNLQKDDLISRLWVLKESLVKATGEGLHRPLSSFFIEQLHIPHQKESRKEHLSSRIESQVYQFVEPIISCGYKCALCASSDVSLFPYHITHMDYENLLVFH